MKRKGSKPDLTESAPSESLDQKGTKDDEQSAAYFTPEDRSKYPQRGHIPGSVLGMDGKIVTNPGLGKTGWRPVDE